MECHVHVLKQLSKQSEDILRMKLQNRIFTKDMNGWELEGKMRFWQAPS